jgi:hypothetical protein
MKLKIYDNKSIGELQDKFTECFPGFRIEFFKGQNDLKRNLPVGFLLTIAKISKKHQEGELQIKSTYTSERIIHDFKTQFDLLVQIYRIENGKPVLLSNDKTLNPENGSLNTKKPGTNANYTGDDEEIRLSL